MKKQVLFMATMLIGLTSATATTAEHAVLNGEDLNKVGYRFAETIVFIERGVKFLIFPDGSFDFNTEINNNVSEAYYRTSQTRRSSVNNTSGAPGTVNRVHYNALRPRSVIITHDSNGKVRRIGNVFINYDRQGRIKRAGSVYMSYLRGNGMLRQVGGLRVNYNSWGEIVHSHGVVNQNNAALNCGVGSGFGGNLCDDFGNDHNFNENFDEDYYYYRTNSALKKHKTKNLNSHNTFVDCSYKQ